MGCDRAASPAGSDTQPGTEAAPYRSAQKLVASLAAGQTGCLRSGSYGGPPIYLKQPDTTLRSYPGERATITAYLEVYPQAQRATITELNFDETHNGNNTGLKLQADGARFSHNKLTKGATGICLIAGSWNSARDIVIERNQIYNCGPADSKYDHQLYLVHTRAASVRWNTLTGNHGGWGVHLYPDADNTLIEHNVIDGNKGGVIYAGDGSTTSDNNTVRKNAITYNTPRWNIEGSWSGGPLGVGNTAYGNCVYSTGPDAPSGIGEESGFSAAANVTLAGSPYANRAAGDYRLRSDSGCADLVGDVAGAAVAKATGPGAARARLTLRSNRRHLRPGHRVLLRGRMLGRRAPVGARVALQVRRRGGWRTVARRRIRRSGRFKARLRIGRARRTRTVRMRALIRGVARSRSIRLRIHA